MTAKYRPARTATRAMLAVTGVVTPVAARAEATGGYNFGPFIAAAVAVLAGIVVMLVVVGATLRRRGQTWGTVVLVLPGLLFLSFVLLAAVVSGL